jgi:hypothetical protein
MANDINKEDPHYKGEYGSIYEVNKKFPTGGVAGDFVVIDGWAHYWNADRGTWCVNAERDSYWDELITNIIEKFKLVRGATYMGVASLNTVPTKVIGAKMYYFATVAGTYKNFDKLVVPQGINVLYSENGSSWVNTTLLEVAQELGVSTNKVVDQKTLNDALNKKFDKESVVQESGEAEDKVMSQKAVSSKLNDLSRGVNNSVQRLENQIISELYDTTLISLTRGIYYSIIENKWSPSESVDNSIIEVEPNSNVRITSGDNVCYYAILASTKHNNGTNVSYAEGCSYQKLNPNEDTGYFAVPADAKAIWFSGIINGANREAKCVYIKGQSKIESKASLVQVDSIQKNLTSISEDIKTINLFDKSTIVNGALLDDGTVSNVTNVWTSDFINVNKETFTVSFKERPSDTYIRIGFYDNNKKFIRRYLKYVSTTEKSFSINDTCEYIRISIAFGLEDGLQVEAGSVATDYKPYLLKSAIDTKSREEILNTNRRVTSIEDSLKDVQVVKKIYDVCIVGGGAAGIATAYALRYSGLKVVLIEEQEYLGGTHCQAWVSSLVPTPAPSFLKEVFYEQMSKGLACMSIGEHSPMTNEDALAIPWKKTFYHNPVQRCLVFNPRALSIKYEADLAPYIDIIKGVSVISAETTGRTVNNISLDNNLVIHAKQYIDSTANDVLLSLIGNELYLGGDSSTRYQSEYGFTEPHGAAENYDFCNAITLLYRCAKGDEDLSNVNADYYDNAAYWFFNSDPSKIYFNSINYVSGANSGIEAVNDGFETKYNVLKEEMIKHWKTIKNGKMVNAFPHPTSEYKYDGVAPMLGVRESYRAKCERMLHESMLYKNVSLDNIKSSDNNLDKVIAVGTYIADLFNDPQISNTDASTISSKIAIYGVPYGCIIPKNFDNVLVASRGAGFTHIAASSFKLTRNMMQLGWAAGYATRILNEDELDNYRNVDVEKLQSDNYASITTMVQDALTFNS